ncbi:MAG: hypothetical protein EB078_10430 [Proteobacteria bacterium]|nr:hypothetical protein [Pseudomonadota bacterium]NDD05312.1 hypothetical protein [Pseudomonadota bacterium]
MEEMLKVKHQRRIEQKSNYIAKQTRIAKSRKIPIDQPHRYHKKSAMTCGNPDCPMCANRRKVFKEKTIQELSFEQIVEWRDDSWRIS